MTGFGRAVVGASALILLATPAMAQERHAITGEHVAIYNLAGQVEVTGTSGGSVTVDVLRGGADSRELSVDIGAVDGRQTLRVLYPSDRVVYNADGWNGSAQVRVRDDGTWGGDGGGFFGGGDRVRVSSRGSGLEAHADLRVAVPRGQRVDIYLAVGRITASNVDGRVVLDTHAGAVRATDMRGSLTIDTGSGSVEVAGVEGDLEVDTGSGGVRASGVRGNTVIIDTGSGSVAAESVVADRIVVDTGSGRIGLLGSSGRSVTLDTGSGSVEAELSGEIDDLEVDTGSGSVTLRLAESLSATLEADTGSGGIDVDFPMEVSHRSRTNLRGRIGDGRGSITVDTGSGSIRIHRL